MRVLSSFYHPLWSCFKGVIVWGDKEDKGGQEVNGRMKEKMKN
jgi:hypothetical protein